MTPAPPAGPALRDIHVPDPSWWPPAPGWWGLVILVLLLLAVLVWWLRRYMRRRRKLRALEVELRAIEAQYAQDQDKAALAGALSRLLRRVTRLRGGKTQLRGPAWLAELERLAPARMQANNVAVLDSAPYQSSADFDAESLLHDCRQWLRCALVGNDA